MTVPLGWIEDRIREEGGLLGRALAGTRGPTPYADALDERRGRAVEAIREGYLLHYGASRLFAVSDDPDLGLLAGDRLYALGLAELAALGDLAAIREMAHVIAESAAAHAAHDAVRADAAWNTGTRTLAHGR